MLRLLKFLYRNRIFVLFIFLEGVSFWLIVQYNNRYNTYFLNSSNALAGAISEKMNAIDAYFSLKEANQALYEENLRLRKLLSRQNRSLEDHKSIEENDSATFSIYPARIVNATYRKSQNYLTLKIQDTEKIEPGMGVISDDGVIGRIKSVSSGYATVTSLLDPNLMISGRVSGNRALCTVQWDGKDPLTAPLKYVPRHLELHKGDSVFTSGFDAVFPQGVLLGVVWETDRPIESPFYQAQIRLATDFTQIETAYIVGVKDKAIRKKLEEEINE